jgi:hypothetical protein
VGDEREDVAEELRRLREEARRRRGSSDRPGPEEAPSHGSPAAASPEGTPRGPVGGEERPPDPPDAAAVNATWQTAHPPSGGSPGLLRRLIERVLHPRFEAQQAFNSAQVRLDNEMLEYLGSRSAATHRHYDRLLGDLGRRLDEIDERHATLERELVGHVQDLVRRIDLVLADGSRGRLGLEFALEETRERLDRLEKVLRPPE